MNAAAGRQCGHTAAAQDRPRVRVGVEPAVIERHQARRPRERLAALRGGERTRPSDEHGRSAGAAPPSVARRCRARRRSPGATTSAPHGRRQHPVIHEHDGAVAERLAQPLSEQAGGVLRAGDPCLDEDSGLARPAASPVSPEEGDDACDVGTGHHGVRRQRQDAAAISRPPVRGRSAPTARSRMAGTSARQAG